MRHCGLAWLLGLAALSSSTAQEGKLPDPLTLNSGQPVTTADAWRNVRRGEVLEHFRREIYGRAPVGRPTDEQFALVEEAPAMHGQATRKQVAITFSGPGGAGRINLLVFVPRRVSGPVPCFLLICHRGPENIDPTRQVQSPFWPAERLIERGYAAATFHVADVDADKYDGFKDGVHALFDPKDQPRAADAWGTIAAWAWGASRALDYLETDQQIDARRVAVIGHSRGGKTALWCGAEDERFALVISNDSGSTGAALARIKQGERVRDITRGFPHWFCTNYNRYRDNEAALPVDQHLLIALMAPRLVYVASAEEDRWADPQAEFLACVHAGPVYRLLGHTGLASEEPPQPGAVIHGGRIGYHLRPGKHDLTEYDWKCFLDFADRHWK